MYWCFDQGNEVYGGGDDAVGIFLHRSSDNAIVKGEELIISTMAHHVVPFPRATDSWRVLSRLGLGV